MPNKSIMVRFLLQTFYHSYFLSGVPSPLWQSWGYRWEISTTVINFLRNGKIEKQIIFLIFSDLWSAGITEIPRPGSLVGPTFACLMGRSFHNIKFGDRFWYENGGWKSSFTVEQINEIRKVKLSRILCDNSDSLQTVQVHSYRQQPEIQNIFNLNLKCILSGAFYGFTRS